MTRKRNGSGIIVLLFICCMAISLIAYSAAQISGAGFRSAESYSIAVQALQHAQNRANLLQLGSYANAKPLPKQQINGTNFFEEIIIGAETAVPGYPNVKQKTATVKIYAFGDTIARVSLNVLKTSIDSTLPQGSIFAWYGTLSNLPLGFKLCDGTNGTPDLRDRFLVGAGQNYGIGEIGGADEIVITEEEMPAHRHFGAGVFAWGGFDAGGPHNGVDSAGWNKGFGFCMGDNPPFDGKEYKFTTAESGGDQPHENRPPYFAVYYIMRA